MGRATTHPLLAALRRAHRKVERAEAALDAAKRERAAVLVDVQNADDVTDVQAGELCGVKKQTVRDWRHYGVLRRT
jgi:hypothetical protein